MTIDPDLPTALGPSFTPFPLPLATLVSASLIEPNVADGGADPPLSSAVMIPSIKVDFRDLETMSFLSSERAAVGIDEGESSEMIVWERQKTKI